MKESKFFLAIDTLIKLSVVAALIIAASTKQQYGYYNFLRWLVMTSYIYIGYKSFGKKQFGLLIFFCAVALMFNPFQKFWFQKNTWHLIDYTIAGITVLTIIYDWALKKKIEI
jgi:hypothetical protein